MTTELRSTELRSIRIDTTPPIRARKRPVVQWREPALALCISVFFVVTGGLSGILIGAIIINWLSPGHPFYVQIKSTLESFLY